VFVPTYDSPVAACADFPTSMRCRVDPAKRRWCVSAGHPPQVLGDVSCLNCAEQHAQHGNAFARCPATKHPKVPYHSGRHRPLRLGERLARPNVVPVPDSSALHR